MPTNGKCVRCGYRAPVSCFVEAAGDGEILCEYIKLPQVVQQPFYKYLSLFRPLSGCALQVTKTLRLTREMVALVSTGYVSEKDKPDRPCAPSFWAMGMEQMLSRADRLSLPLKNHNYLRTIVWQLADQADAGREAHHHQQVMSGNARVHRDDPPAPDGLSQIERAWLAKYGSLPGTDPEKNPDIKRLANDLTKRLRSDGEESDG